MNKYQKFIARLFRIKTKNIIVRKVVYAVSDREFSGEELKAVSGFLNSKAGNRLCDYLISQKFAVASKSARKLRNGDLWQGYAAGFEDAINSVLAFRQPDDNGDPGDSREVGLEELAEKLDQIESR